MSIGGLALMLLVSLISAHPFMCNFNKFMGVQEKNFKDITRFHSNEYLHPQIDIKSINS